MIRILDSRREEFRLSKAYAQKIDVVNVITAPEIEMLIIQAEGAYDQFKRCLLYTSRCVYETGLQLYYSSLNG